MSRLFSPIEIGPLTLKNRIVIAPMCQYASEDGRATDWHTIHLGQLSQSGAGLLFIEATAVEPEGRISAQDLGLWNDETQAALAGALASVRRYSSMPIAIQLAHAGRKASTTPPWVGGPAVPPSAPGGWRPQAPSALPYAAADAPPLALDAAGLARIKQAFVDAARRSHALGIEVIEVHAAHGYLLHEFLSPLSNARDDAYGGSLDNRMRFPLEVFEAVRAAVPASVPVGIRISATDWVEGGWDIEQSVVFAKAVEALGGAFIDVSSGGLSAQQQIEATPGYQLPFAQRLKQELKMPVIAVGLITEARQAEAVLAEGQADAVALARGMMFNPHWPWHAAAELGAAVEVPPQYWRSAPQGVKSLFEKKIPGGQGR